MSCQMQTMPSNILNSVQMAPSRLQGYPVFVTQRDGQFELAIRELMLTVVASDFQTAYNDLLNRLEEFVRAAKQAGVLDEIPLPALAPSLRRAIDAPPHARISVVRR